MVFNFLIVNVNQILFSNNKERGFCFMGRTIYFYAATSALFCCFAFCFYLLAFCFEKNQMFGLDITNDKDLPAFKELRKNIIKRLLAITGFYLLPTLFFICCFGEQNKAYPLIPLFLMISSYALFFLNSKSKVILMQNKMFVPEKEKDFISFVFSVIFALPFFLIAFDIFKMIVRFDSLPALLASHWKINGSIDMYSAKSVGRLVFMTSLEVLILALFVLSKNAFYLKNKKVKNGNGIRQIQIFLLNIQMWGFTILFTEMNDSVLNSRNLDSHLFWLFIGIEITILFVTIIFNLLLSKKG